MLAAALAFAGALVFGAADFLGGLAAQRVRSIVVTCVAAAIGVAVLLSLYPFVGGHLRGSDIAWGALSGVFGAGAIVLLYACLAIGPMSILSPLTAVISAIAPILWGLFIEHETLAPIGYVGLGVAVVAVVLVGFIPGERSARPSTRGLVMAVGAGLCIGGFFIVIDRTSHDSGLIPLIANRTTITLITAAVIGALAILAMRQGKDAASILRVSGAVLGATPSGHADLEHAAAAASPAVVGARRTPAWWLAIACGVLDAIANIAVLLALRSGDLSIVSALTATYPAGTILLAALVLHERIAAVQLVGLALALAAGILLALA